MTPPEMAVAQEAARAAGAILSRFFRDGVTMREKDVANLVSDADLQAEAAIVEVIREHFPTHEVLGEESHEGSLSAEHLWVVDPLDGTANFAHKIPHFAVSIAYYRAGRAECGVVFNPISDEWYTAVRGEGAFLNGRPIHVSRHAHLNEVIIGFGLPYDRGRLMEATLSATAELIRAETHGVRRIGTAAVDFCLVANGQFGAYFEYLLSPWDFAAGRLICEEAGGTVTDARGDPLTLGRRSVLASNGPLHEAMLEVLKPRHP